MFPRGGLAVQGHEHLFWGDTSLHYDFRGSSISECIYWNLLYYTLKGMNPSQLMAHEPHAPYDSHEWSSISLYVTSVTSEVIKLEWRQTVSLADPWNSICGKQTFSPISPGRVTQECWRGSMHCFSPLKITGQERRYDFTFPNIAIQVGEVHDSRIQRRRHRLP